jgi:hypothetical protein
MDEAGCYFLRVCWLMVKVVCLLNKGKKAIKKGRGIENCVMEEIIAIKDMVHCRERIT